ncbi:MAG: hypothetical protein KDA91_15470 [Planctomycetaceae bacterium]|nr:hypothetical protein [Planctomycetaceae bacterium]
MSLTEQPRTFLSLLASLTLVLQTAATPLDHAHGDEVGTISIPDFNGFHHSADSLPEIPSDPSETILPGLIDSQTSDILVPHSQSPIRPDDKSTAEISATGESCSNEFRINIDDDDKDNDKSLFGNFRQPYTVYRSHSTELSWIPSSGENFGLIDWQSDPYLKSQRNTGFSTAFNVHWFNGPISPDIPSRVYDFCLGFQHRDSFSPLLSYDLSAQVGAYSDFEGSAREGIRFPAHAVGMLHVNLTTDVVFGVDYLDRDDIRILPVFGLSIRDVMSPSLRMDLVFPRPRIEYELDNAKRVYLAGALGGGTWDMEYPDESDDVVTIRDYRLMLGFERMDSDGDLSAIEFGYIFDRHLRTRTQPSAIGFDDAFMIRFVSRH